MWTEEHWKHLLHECWAAMCSIHSKYCLILSRLVDGYHGDCYYGDLIVFFQRIQVTPLKMESLALAVKTR